MTLRKRIADIDSERLATIAGFAIAYALLLFLLRPWLILSDTTVTGGDTGSHHYLAYYLEHFLLPGGEIRGWSNDWFAGFPVFYFYFPAPYLLIALLDLFLPYNIAFKLITVAGAFALPVIAYSLFRKLGAPRPMPMLAAGAAAAFLAQENYTIYGANIASALAGEFSFSISFALILLFYGYLSESTQMPWRFGGAAKFVAAAAILGVAALSHAIPAAFASGCALFFIFWRSRVETPGLASRLVRAAAAPALAFGLVASWAFPLLMNLKWTANMAWIPKKELALLMPLELIPAIPLLIIGLAWTIRRRERWALFVLWMMLLGALFFYFVPSGSIWNTRFLPFYYLGMLFMSAIGVYAARRHIARLPKISERWVPVLAILIVAIAFASTRAFLPSWIEWNYSGFEAKKGAGDYKKINDYIKSLPPGRVMWEYTPANDDYGTPRSLELIPYWTGKPTMEGLLIESAITAPFHFINQAELSVKSTRAIQGIDYPLLDVQSGLAHLRMFNIRYFMAASSEVVSATNENPSARLLKKIGRYTIFELPVDGYVTIPRYKVQRHSGENWRPFALDWYRNPELRDAPVVWDFNASERSKRAARNEFLDLKGGADHSVLVAATKASGQPPKVHSKIEPNKISFTTNQIGKPHWIKVSYFPNWHAEGADGPFLATPSFMMVIPREKHVTLTFGRTIYDDAGLAVSTVSVIVAFTLLFGSRLSIRRDRLLRKKKY